MKLECLTVCTYFWEPAILQNQMRTTQWSLENTVMTSLLINDFLTSDSTVSLSPTGQWARPFKTEDWLISFTSSIMPGRLLDDDLRDTLWMYRADVTALIEWEKRCPDPICSNTAVKSSDYSLRMAGGDLNAHIELVVLIPMNAIMSVSSDSNRSAFLVPADKTCDWMFRYVETVIRNCIAFCSLFSFWKRDHSRVLNNWSALSLVWTANYRFYCS